MTAATTKDPPLGHPINLMRPCGHVGPFGWVNHLGNVVPVTCNRPVAHVGPHAHSTTSGARQYEWTDSDPTIHTACPKGPWEVVRRVR